MPENFKFDDISVPCYQIVLSKEQADKIRDKKAKLFVHDGKTAFPLMDDDGRPTGEIALFVIFS